VASVAVIGASTNPGKYGNKAVRAYLRQGWTVYPVNPQQAKIEGKIEGLASYADVESIPAKLDRAALYVPASVGVSLLPGIARKGISELFVNPGAESDELLAEAERLGLPVIQACAIVDIGERPSAY
jgi:predicted CoA-binding protein